MVYCHNGTNSKQGRCVHMKKRLLSFALVLLSIMLLFPRLSLPVSAAEDDKVTAISAGSRHSVAVESDGSLWAWGDNSNNQLGDGTIINRRTPVKIMDDAAKVSTGGGNEAIQASVTSLVMYASYTFAIKTDGSLWAWGDNAYGQLGDGTVVTARRPVKIMDDVTAVSAGSTHAMAIKTDGSLWAWGDNAYGQLGNSTIINTRTPIKIMDGVVSVSAGPTHTAAIKTDGSLWAWGDNAYGQLGNSTIINTRTPIKIMDGVTSVSAGTTHTMAVKKDASLWAWGDNMYGQLGDGTNISRRTPIKIMDGVASVSVGSTHTMAIKADASLWAWGDNAHSQLGDGLIINRREPIRIMGDVSLVSAGLFRTIAVKKNGSLWTWGDNQYGQLGDGTTNASRVPVRIIGQDTPSGTGQTKPPTSSISVKPTQSTVYVNGTATAFDAYNIGGNNYFKLRDLAFALNGTEKQFSVDYDEITRKITLTSGQPYEKVGGEMVPGSGTAKPATPTASKIYLDGKELNFTVYIIGGNNFFKLRDLMEVLDVFVGYDDASKDIALDTSNGYIAE